MIWALDNGMDYSDHQLVFVEAPDNFDMRGYLDAETVLERAAAARAWQKHYSSELPAQWVVPAWRVLATAGDVSWFQGAPMKLEEFAPYLRVYRSPEDPAADPAKFGK